MTTAKRDPRIHPAVGDRLATHLGWRVVVGVTPTSVTFDRQSYSSRTIGRKSIFIRAWRAWAKYAKVIES